jgi:hypothetical protein
VGDQELRRALDHPALVDFNGDGKVLYFPVKMPGQPVAPPGPSIVADVLYPNVTYDHGAVPQAK